MKIVLAGSIESWTASTASGWVESSTCRRRPGESCAERAADDLGAERGAAHAEQDGVGVALVPQLRRERRADRRRARASCRRRSASRAGCRSPAHRVRPTAPRPGARSARATRAATAASTRTRTGSSSSGGQAAGDRRRTAGGDRGPLAVDAGEQAAHRVLELLEAVDAAARRSPASQVDAGLARAPRGPPPGPARRSAR